MSNNSALSFDASLIPSGNGQKLVLGFSGGLDTTFCGVFWQRIKAMKCILYW